MSEMPMNTSAEDLRWKLLDCVVPKEWLDRNGHMNMQYYFALVDQALAALMKNEFAPRGAAGVAPHLAVRSAQIQYKKELFAGQAAVVYVQPLAFENPAIKLCCQILATDAPNALSAECVVEGRFVAASNGESLGLPPETIDEIVRRVEPVPARKIPLSFQIPAQERHWFISAEGAAPNVGALVDGVLGLQGHLNLFDRGGIGMFAELARSSSVFVPGSVGGFALSTGIEYQAPLRPGDGYRIRSRASAVGRKTVSFIHEMFRAEDAKRPAATCDHTMAFIDMTRRRSMPVPEAFKEILEKRYDVEIEAVEG